MNETTKRQLSLGFMVSAALIAAMAIGAGAANADSDLYIDRPLCQYCPAETQEITEPPLPAPGEWPMPEVVWEECAGHDDFGIQECFISFENGHEVYYWIKNGLKYYHYPLDDRTPSSGTVSANNGMCRSTVKAVSGRNPALTELTITIKDGERTVIKRNRHSFTISLKCRIKYTAIARSGSKTVTRNFYPGGDVILQLSR